MSTFYITTPIYYVNDVPHLGHAYTTMVCDALARFHRMRGDDTRFLTGTDEHGQKVEEAAGKRGLTPQQLVDQVAPRFDELWKHLGITGYRFIRTTGDNHKKVVHALWNRIRATNPDDLYLETYQGWYCVGCEAFYTESQLTKDAGDTWVCSTHKRPVSWIDKERSWFFRLSKYAEPLLAHIQAHPEFVRPEAYRNEVVAFLKGGLKDLSVSRTSFSWGIPVPEPDPQGMTHVTYVWMDALTNYLSDLSKGGALEGGDIDRYWQHAIHVIGKDILRFHAVYWPAFLMAANLPLPKGIFAHGWWTVRGEKISKSLPATRIDPLVLSDALAAAGGPASERRPLGIDAMRYYLLREVPLGNDGDFTFESLFGRFNADLANDLGNLINRSLTMIGKFSAAHPPKRDDTYFSDATENPYFQLELAAHETVKLAAAQFDAFSPSRALELIWRFIGVANRFIDQTQPWAMAKANDPALGHCLWCLQASLWLIARLVDPVLPATSKRLREWIGDTSEVRWPEPADGRVLAVAPDTLSAHAGARGSSSRATWQPLFPRLDDKAQQAIVVAVVGDAAAVPAPVDAAVTKAETPAKVTNAQTTTKTKTKTKTKSDAKPEASDGSSITFDEFSKVELRVGRVVSATAVPKAKKLLHLQVDLGEAAPRSIVAGIAEVYTPEQLAGKQVLVVANLAPATIRGIRSEGMILAAGDDTIVGLSSLDRDAPAGTRVR